MNSRRLRAPTGDGEVLALPALDHAIALALANEQQLRGWNYNFQGRWHSLLRRMARSEMAEASRAYLNSIGAALPATAPEPALPWVVSGHQPELFHAGVWVKNFAVGAIARRLGAVPVHLIVDNDLPKSAGVRVPFADERMHTRFVEFDDIQPEVPFEAWRGHDPVCFDTFDQRVKQQGLLASEPILDAFWPVARRLFNEDRHIGRAFSGARHHIEERWGLASWELPLSAMCDGDAFRWFLSHLLAQLPRFHAIHNAALGRYRQRNHIRSRNHPVPDLASEGEWLEAPVWAWHVDRPRRKPLLVRADGRTIQLRRPGADAPLLELRLSPESEACCAVEQLRALGEKGWRLRTRALTTTMFARLIVGDLFVHGIGGAKYDELGDEIVREFFGIEPPPFLTLSMTAWLDLPERAVPIDDLGSLTRKLRDLDYNAERYLNADTEPAVRELVLAKQAAIAAPQDTRALRVERWHTLRRLNRKLSSLAGGAREAALAESVSLRESLLWNQQAHARDFSFVLHDGASLRRAYERALAPIGPW